MPILPFSTVTQEQQPPDVYVGAMPPTPSPINWEERQWSLRRLFTYFCTEPCPPSSDEKIETTSSEELSMTMGSKSTDCPKQVEGMAQVICMCSIV